MGIEKYPISMSIPLYLFANSSTDLRANTELVKATYRKESFVSAYTAIISTGVVSVNTVIEPPVDVCK